MGRQKKKQKAEPPPPPPVLTAPIAPHPILPPPSPAPRRARQPEPRAGTLTATPLYRDRIWVVHDFLSPAECRAWIAFAERAGLERTSQPATYTHAFRCNDRVELRDAAAARAIWGRLSQLVPRSVAPRSAAAAAGCNPKIRLYRYEQGHRFGKHVDESELLDGPPGQALMTGATVLIYLNGGGGGDAGRGAHGGEGGCDERGAASDAGAQGVPLCGGETAFYDGPGDEREVLRFRPRQGSLLLHGHGNLCLTHEAREVVSGTKYVLRTDVNYAMN